MDSTDPAPSPAASRAQRVALAVAALLMLAHQGLVFTWFALPFTDEDQTIFWVAAQDYLHLTFHEPLWYGSPYSTHLESLLAVPLLALGMRVELALPVVVALLPLVPWVLLAHLAWRRGHPLVASTILLSPLLLPLRYSLIVTHTGFVTGVVAAAWAAWLVLRGVRRPASWFVFGLLGPLALLLHNNALFVLGPLGVLVFLRHARERALYAWAVPGALLGALAYHQTRAFYVEHPNHVVHAQWPMKFSVERILEGVALAPRYFADVAPRGVPPEAWAAVLAVLAILVVARTRDWRLLLACGVALLAPPAALGVDKIFRDGSASVFFSYSRAFVGLPVVTWLLVLEGVDTLRQRARPALGWALPGLAFAVALSGLGSLKEDLPAAMDTRGAPVGVVPTASVVTDCGKILGVATAHQVGLVVFAGSKVNTYGCAALWYGRVETLFPGYDRRTWRMEDENTRFRARILLADRPPTFCESVKPEVGRCTIPSPQVPMPMVASGVPTVMALLRSLGFGIRAF